jgi:hypothetical protein
MAEKEVLRSASTFRVVCAWCGATVSGPGDANALTSHGVCPTCFERLAHSDEVTNAIARTHTREPLLARRGGQGSSIAPGRAPSGAV